MMLWAVCRNFRIELHPSTTPDSMKMLETFLITPKVRSPLSLLQRERLDVKLQAHKCLLMFTPREQ